MAYQFDTYVLGSSAVEIPCQQQHDAYAAEFARVSALAAQLNADAATCHRLHGEYATAVSRYDEVSLCKQAYDVYQAAKDERKACDQSKAAYESAVAAYQKAAAEHAALVTSTEASNVSKKAAYESQYEKIRSENYTISQNNASANQKHNQLLTDWQRQKTAYDSYQAAVAAQDRSLAAQWADKIKANPSLNNYQWLFRHSRCNGTPMICKTRSWHDQNQSKCNPVRGLGADTRPIADDCKVWTNYPYCPDQCPGGKTDNPGNPPGVPTPKPYKDYPAVPTYASVIAFDAFLKQKGVAVPGSSPTCNPSVPAKPDCDKNANYPLVPAKPTCTPPNIPPMPIEPTCQVSSFGQVGAMWLLLALGAGGLYWYSTAK